MAMILKPDATADKKPAARSVTGLAGFNLADLADEGRHRLEECREQVRQLLENANQQAEQLHQEAETRGYEEGLRRAAVDAEHKLQAKAELRAKDSLRILHRAVDELYQAHQDWTQQYSQSLISIALAAAEKIVKQKLDREPAILVEWAEEALRSTRAASQLILAVHPETLAQLGPALDELLASPDLPERTHVEPDKSVDLNAIIVRQAGGEIRAGLQAQLARLEELLA